MVLGCATDSHRTTRQKTPDCLRALGANDMPATMAVGGKIYTHCRTFKHDFFAATGVYECDGDRLKIKFGRRIAFLGFPMAWIGEWLARHEMSQLRRAAGIPGIPVAIPVADKGVVCHRFVAGEPLRNGAQPGDAFFMHLERTLAALHARGMAYVDLEKPANIVVGEDGLAYLIDFQISWPLPFAPLFGVWPLTAFGLWLERRMQQGDRYHLLKMRRRFRPDQLTQAELERSYHRPWPIRLHQRLTRPFTLARRWALTRLGARKTTAERGLEPEGGSLQ